LTPLFPLITETVDLATPAATATSEMVTFFIVWSGGDVAVGIAGAAGALGTTMREGTRCDRSRFEPIPIVFAVRMPRKVLVVVRSRKGKNRALRWGEGPIGGDLDAGQVYDLIPLLIG
jgi:hypothetical protein